VEDSDSDDDSHLGPTPAAAVPAQGDDGVTTVGIRSLLSAPERGKRIVGLSRTTVATERANVDDGGPAVENPNVRSDDYMDGTAAEDSTKPTSRPLIPHAVRLKMEAAAAKKKAAAAPPPDEDEDEDAEPTTQGFFSMPSSRPIASDVAAAADPGNAAAAPSAREGPSAGPSYGYGQPAAAARYGASCACVRVRVRVV
jgi:hypothetical protein